MRNRQYFQSFNDVLERVTPDSALTTVNQIVKIKKGYSAKHSATGETLQPSSVTDFLEDTGKAPREFSLDIETFEMPERMLEEIICATARCPTQKASGLDLIIGEALRSSAKLDCSFAAELWKACRRIRTVLMAWGEIEMVEICKKGDASDPENYKTIALLSHVRKNVESALDSEVQEKYRFHSAIRVLDWCRY